MTSLRMTRHAEDRANQRGVTHQMLDDLIGFADVEAPVGSGCCLLRVSRRRLRDPRLRAVLQARTDRLAGLAIVCAADGAIVTVLHDRAGREGRHYRRGR